MKIFLDSANLNELREAVSWVVNLRLTTLPSPTHFVGTPARSGAFYDAAGEFAQ